ncbi:MAG: diguanylate cyclase [Alphaproteobacteria bacterium]
MSASLKPRLTPSAGAIAGPLGTDEIARAVVENVIEGIVVIDESGTIHEVNPAVEHMFGYDADDLIGRNVSCLMGSPHAARHDGYIERYLRTGETRIIGTGREVEARRRDGSAIPVELSVVPLTLGGRNCFVGVLRDLSERREDEARRAFDLRLGNAVGHAWDQFVAANRWSKTNLFDDALRDLLELSDSRAGFVGEVVIGGEAGRAIRIVASTGNNGRALMAADDPRVGAILEGEELLLQKSGVGAPYMALPARAGNRVVGIVGLQGREDGYDADLADALQPLTSAMGSILVGLQKVEAQRAAERDLYRTQERLRRLATRDPLTGLLNRGALLETLSNGFEHACELGLALSVLFVDIDHFKAVNDSHGHAAGDEVLRAVAKALDTTVRPQDLVGRYGGEEFVVGLLETDRVAAAMVAERIRVAVARLQASVPVTISIGMASLGPDTGTLEELLAVADAALYRAKANGRNRVES